MTVLVVVNDPPYGTERAYNGLRLAISLATKDRAQVRVFLVGDGASCAKAGQQVPQGHYNLETMLSSVIRHGGTVGVCGSCMDARGITDGDLVKGASRSSLDEWAKWTLESDRVITF